VSCHDDWYPSYFYQLGLCLGPVCGETAESIKMAFWMYHSALQGQRRGSNLGVVIFERDSDGVQV
jgi:hypothetical protein